MRNFFRCLVVALSVVPNSVVVAQSDGEWNPDFDGDNLVGVLDLIALLSVFGEQDGDSDGFWDESEECMGATVADFEGHFYQLIAIGDQCWFRENLRSAFYANGDTIIGELSASEWSSTTFGAQAVYGEGLSECGGDCIEEANLEAYGRLYNWNAVNDSRGLCPTGWHVPADWEWMTLETELGMSCPEANGGGDRGINEGDDMKSSSSDNPSWDGTNLCGFSALPGGRRFYESLIPQGIFGSQGNYGYWWSSSSSGAESSYFRRLTMGNGRVYRSSAHIQNGFSVRCVRD